MKLGYVGLGKIGSVMVERLLERRHEVVVFDTDDEVMQRVAWKGAIKAQSLWNLVGLLERPRLVWLMIPHEQVDAVLTDMVPLLHDGDTIIDGSNSLYKDSVRRAEELAKREIQFLDAGVSGGSEGAREGACVMVGGAEKVFKKFEPLFRDIAAENGYLHAGSTGAGHFAKMVHNDIEYGMARSIADGFEVLKQSSYEFDLAKIARLYNHKSDIESRMVGRLQVAYETYGEDLKEAAEGSLKYSDKVLSALRGELGGREIS